MKVYNKKNIRVLIHKAVSRSIACTVLHQTRPNVLWDQAFNWQLTSNTAYWMNAISNIPDYFEIYTVEVNII